MKEQLKPLIGITMGDMNGIGPEIILKSFLDSRIFDLCTPVVYGSQHVLNEYKRLLHFPDLPLQLIKRPQDHKRHRLNVIDIQAGKLEVEPGKPSLQSGALALSALETAVGDALSGSLNALVTAPLSKEHTALSLKGFTGHTDYIAEKCDRQALMILCSEKLRISMVTTHVPVARIKDGVTVERIISKTEALHRSLIQDFGISRPKIAVLGLNPHAGEGGLLGKEESEIILPAINQVKTKGMMVFGPYASDGFFGSGNYLEFDGILAMYHDQALIPFKTLCFEDGVNFTAGLQIIRTSPDHGTAFNIAGTKVASEMSFRSSLYMACSVFQMRKAPETVAIEA